MHLKIQNAAITIAGNTILEEVNFEIKDRDKIAIVGRNGAGKTTLLKAIMDNSLFSEGIGEENFYHYFSRKDGYWLFKGRLRLRMKVLLY